MQKTIVRKSNCPGMVMQSFRLMGNHFEISVPLSGQADSLIQAAVDEIRRIERLLTTYNEDSQTNLINRNAGISPVTVDAEMSGLIERSLKISDLTQGAFDITYGSVDKRFWNFDKNMTSLPDRKEALKRVELINYRNVILDKEKRTVFLTQKGMKIGFGGIGKGYAAERAKILLKNLGVESGIVNAAGDLTVWGKQPDGKSFTVGIADPELADCPFSYLELSEMAVATSGNYEKYVMIEGKRYSHTIDPRTGYPVSGIKSVTIICSNAEIADAMATPVMVMGVKAGLDLVNQIRGIGCIIIDDMNKLYVTDNIRLCK
jgi:FAD:protein FMN transferase